MFSCYKRCVCKQFQLDLILLPPFLYLLPSHAHSQTLISSQRAPLMLLQTHPSTSCSSLTTGCVSSTFSHFPFTPFPISWDKIPSRPVPPPLLQLIQCLGVISPPVCPVVRDSPKTRYEKILHPWSVHHLVVYSFNNLL